MRRSLTWKLIAAFLGVSLFAIALVTAVSAAVTANEFDRFVSEDAQGDFVAFVGNYYRANGTLSGLDDAVISRLDQDADLDTEQPRLIPFALTDAQGFVVNHGEGYRLGEQVP